MTRRVARTTVSLHPSNEPLREEELKAILRGADDLIMSGGRTLLARILKGSRIKKILELGMQNCPAYGAFKGLDMETVLSKIDRAISEGYLTYEYDGRLPLLVFTPEGWRIELLAYSQELYTALLALAEGKQASFDIASMKDRNLKVRMFVLDLIEVRKDVQLLPVLEKWKEVESRDVRQRIREVVRTIEAWVRLEARRGTT